MNSIHTDISYPTLKQLQNAHRKLLQEYIGAIDIASRLPFIINISRILIPSEKETTSERFNRRLYILFTPIVWKPFVRFLIEAHIKAKMKELVVAYQQLSLRLPTAKKFDRLREELKSAVTECNQLSDTLTTWKNGQTIWAGIIPVAIGLVTSWVSADDIFSLFGLMSITSTNILPFLTTALQYFQIFIWIWVSIGLILILLNFAFQGKRYIFLPRHVKQRIAVPFRNIYSSEDILFELIGYKKTVEFAIDFVSMIFLFSLITIGFFLPFIIVMAQLAILPGLFWGFILFAVFYFLFFTVLIGRDMKRRWN
ncbi:MAG TPA: hypothetical protein VLA72_03940 [Anaerolineales bacterium]|nr:hypothetical protein [Anaerolineales bacterium]